VDYNIQTTQNYTKPAQQHQASKGFIILQRVWILQSLNTTWFNNLPLFDEDKSLMLVLYLVESEAVLARYRFKQNIELLIFG